MSGSEDVEYVDHMDKIHIVNKYRIGTGFDDCSNHMFPPYDVDIR